MKFGRRTVPKVSPRVRHLTILLHINTRIDHIIDDLAEYLPEFSALQHVHLMLYDQFHEDRTGRPILPAIYRLAENVKARGCRLS